MSKSNGPPIYSVSLVVCHRGTKQGGTHHGAKAPDDPGEVSSLGLGERGPSPRDWSLECWRLVLELFSCKDPGT